MKVGKMGQLSGRKSLLDSVELTYTLSTDEAEELIPLLEILGVFPLKSVKTQIEGALYIYGFGKKSEQGLDELNEKLGEISTFAPFYKRVKRLASLNKMLVDTKIFVHYVPGELYVASVEMDITREHTDEKGGKGLA
jgi:hypothetical protein